MGGAIHGCCNSGKGVGPVVLSRVNEVPHELFEGTDPSLNLAIRLVVLLGRHPDLDTKGLHHLLPKLRGKAGVLVKDNAKREAMDVEDTTVEFLEDLLRGSSVLEWDEMCVGGKAVHYDHDRYIPIGFVKRASEVYG